MEQVPVRGKRNVTGQFREAVTVGVPQHAILPS